MSSRITSVLAWLVCGGIILAVVFAFVREYSIRKGQVNLLELAGALAEATIPICFALVGSLILSQQSRNVIGWLVMLPALAFAMTALLSPITSGFTTAPAAPPLLLYPALYFAGASWVFFIFPIFLIALLFPTGKPLTPRWRWVVAIPVGMVVLFLVVAAFAEEFGSYSDDGTLLWSIASPIGFITQDMFEGIFGLPWGIGLGALAILSVLCLILRYRRAGSVERQQLKWLLFAAALFAATYIPAVLSAGELASFGLEILDVLFLLAVVAFPIAIGIAILRYRLFDIDVIIRRTVIYALVTALLVSVFFGSVIVLQQIFANFTASGNNDFITVISTLMIAALFVPLRNRVQSVIDRRFNRKKYDAQHVLTKFGETVRDETDLERLTNELVNVVEETMQPKSVSLWLKQTKDG